MQKDFRNVVITLGLVLATLVAGSAAYAQSTRQMTYVRRSIAVTDNAAFPSVRTISSAQADARVQQQYNAQMQAQQSRRSRAS